MIGIIGNKQPVLQGSGHFIAPNAAVIGDVHVSSQCSIWFNAVLRGDNDAIIIKPCCNIQDGAILHTDPGIELLIEQGCSIGHQAVLHGCSIGENTLIGIGSTILNGAKIGTNSIVGAGSLVTENKHYEDGVLLLGSPAKVVRDLTQEEIRANQQTALSYTEKAALYAKAFRPT